MGSEGFDGVTSLRGITIEGNGMVLSDGVIMRELEKGNIEITPFDEKLLQPAGVDVRLGKDFRVWLPGGGTPEIDPTGISADAFVNYDRVICTKDHPYFHLFPNQSAIGTTFERIKVPFDIRARLDGKSSLSRIGLLVNVTANYIDPGFEGEVSLELMNITNRPIKLVPGMAIAQLSFERLEEPALVPYGAKGRDSKYHFQSGATPAIFLPKIPTRFSEK